jgi:hypothetical protein
MAAADGNTLKHLHRPFLRIVAPANELGGSPLRAITLSFTVLAHPFPFAYIGFPSFVL